MSAFNTLFKGASPTVLAGRVSFLVSASAGILFYFSTSYLSPISYLLSLSFFIIIFLISFLLMRYSIERYVQDKVSVIYETVHHLKKKAGPPSSTTAANINDGDPLEKVNEEMLNWQRENQKEIDRLTILEKYRREFIGNVSHELKTPVFNIQGYLLTLLEGGLEDKSVNRKFLEKAEKSVEKLIKLLNELDMIIRLDTGDLQLNIQQIDLLEILKEVIESLEIKIDKRKIKIKINTDNNERLWVMADEDKITQVLSNLLINSIKYGKENGAIEISFHDMNNQILIEIKDNGIGINEDALNRVFDRFFRTEAARSFDQKGFGLGLSIVKHIIEAHGQTINVNSVIDKGSTFSFTLLKSTKH